MLCSISLSADQFCFRSDGSQVFYIHIIFVFGVWCSVVASISGDLICSLILEDYLFFRQMFLYHWALAILLRDICSSVMNRNVFPRHFSKCFKCY